MLDNHYLPSDVEAQIEALVEHYKYRRYFENPSNGTHADACLGRAEAMIKNAK